MNARQNHRHGGRLVLGLTLQFVVLSGCAEEVVGPAPRAIQSASSAESGSATKVASTPIIRNEQVVQEKTAYNSLTAEEAEVILEQGTELPGKGEYTDLEARGTYICRQCNAALYESSDKFHSDCGWPAFDDEIAGAVDRRPDLTGSWTPRVEIICNNCKGHLGHVFEGEKMTAKDTRCLLYTSPSPRDS